MIKKDAAVNVVAGVGSEVVTAVAGSVGGRIVRESGEPGGHTEKF